MLLYEVVKAFESHQVKYAVVGGYALALHGLLRATVDIDFILSLRLKDFIAAEQALSSVGLKSRLPIRAHDVIKMREEYITKRNLIAWSFVDYANPTRQVDILITKDVEDLTIKKISVGGHKISVVSLEDLLKMKMESGRPQDLVDVERIKEKLKQK